MESKDIREMSEGDINTRIAELEEERFRLQFRAGTETLEDPLRLRYMRRDVARLKTVLREKIIGIAEAETPASLPKAKSDDASAVRKTGSRRARSSKRT